MCAGGEGGHGDGQRDHPGVTAGPQRAPLVTPELECAFRGTSPPAEEGPWDRGPPHQAVLDGACFQRRCGAWGGPRLREVSREILSPKDGWVVSWRCTTASVRAHLLHHLIRLALILSQSVHSSSRGSPPFLGSLRRRQLSEMNYSPHHLHFTACHLALLLLYYLKSPLLQSLAQPPPLLVCVHCLVG